MRFRNLLAAVLLSIFAVLGASSLDAQGIITGTMSGVVQDATGAVIPGATVTAVSKNENQTYTSVSNASGEFNFSSLPVGQYSLTIKMAGFGDLKLDNVLVETGKATGLGVEKLQTGSAVETVEVSTGRNLLETTQSQVTTTFDAEMVADLPTGGGLDQVALLVPGVASTHSANFSNTNGVGLSSNGQRGRSNNFEIDGQSNNDNSVAGSQVFFQNQDALAEIQVITNNFSAAYGRNMGSVVNYVTKSGTNSIHGSGFEYYTGDWLSSMTQGQKDPAFGFCLPGTSVASAATLGCTEPKVPRFTDNTFGGTLGFPILKDKLFGFGSTQWSRDINGATVYTSGTSYFPTQAGLAMLQAEYPNNGGVAELVNYGPFAVKAGSPYSFVTSAHAERDIAICPQNAALNASGCPVGTPLIPFQLVGRTLAPHYYDQEHLGRIDFQATPKDRFFLRYLYQNEPSIPDGGSFASGAFYNVADIAHSVGSDWTHTFGPRWVNQIRYSFQQTTLSFDGGGFAACTIKNLSACPSSVSYGSPYLSLGVASNIPQGRVVKVSQYQDNATWNLGRHSITFGGEFDYQNSPNVFLPDINGVFAFSSLNQSLGGAVNTLSLATGASPNIHFTEPDYAVYFQDDWKVSPSFTANLGLRYEFFGQSLNLLHNVSYAAQNGPNPQWATNLSQTAAIAPTVFPFTPSFKKGVEPRIGFAWNPTSMRKLVVRGGFAINFDPAYYNIALNSYTAAPVVNVSSTSACNGTTINCVPTAGLVNAAIHAQDDQYNPTGGNPGAKSQTTVTPNFRNPYAESYTLGIQYEILKAATLEGRYSGNHTIDLFQSFNGNPTVGPNASGGQGTFSGGAIIPAMATYFPAIAGSYCTASTLNSGTTATTADLGREHCGETLNRVRSNTSFSIYNSLQTSLQTRNLYGFTGSVNFTYGKEIDNTSEVFSTNGGGDTNAFAQNPYNIGAAERSIGATDYKFVTSSGLVYTLPFFKHSHSLLGKVVGGLQFNTLYTFNSGQPFTPSQYYYSLLAYNGAYGVSGSLPQNPTLAAQTGAARGLSEFSMCDYNFNASFTSIDVCRPFIGNPAAPKGTVGLNIGGGQYIDANGNPIARSAARFIVNNGNEALAQGTPFGNVQRNTQFGNSYNNVNFGAFKSFHVTERYNVQLQATLFNALNRGYYGTPGVLIDYAANFEGAYFNNFSQSGGSSFGPSEGSATGARNIQVGAKIQF
jgi:hypothetical protein